MEASYGKGSANNVADGWGLPSKSESSTGVTVEEVPDLLASLLFLETQGHGEGPAEHT